MKTKSYKMVQYTMESGSLDDRKIALRLFDELNFKSNIILSAFRAYTDSNHAIQAFIHQHRCKIVRDITRPDAFHIIIPRLLSNLSLFDLIAIMDIQTEWTYVPQVEKTEEFFLNRSFSNTKSSVPCAFSPFEAKFDEVFGLRFFFDIEYYEHYEIDRTLQNWEILLKKRKYTKTEK